MHITIFELPTTNTRGTRLFGGSVKKTYIIRQLIKDYSYLLPFEGVFTYSQLAEKIQKWYSHEYNTIRETNFLLEYPNLKITKKHQ